MLEEAKAHREMLLFAGFTPLEICEVIHFFEMTVRKYIVTHAFIN